MTSYRLYGQGGESTKTLWVLLAVILGLTGFWFFGSDWIMSQSEDKTLFVAIDGNDTNLGTDQSAPLATIQKALNLANPGDRIVMADGAYRQAVHTVRNGENGQPITIFGGEKAILLGSDGNNRIIEVSHDYIHLEGFTVDGKVSDTGTRQDYRDKLIYVQGTGHKQGVKGLKISRMTIQNAGGECVRLRYFATENEVSNSLIQNCGAYDFVFDEGGKNGEGIYIGTAPEQVRDGRNPTKDRDGSSKNWIHHNKIVTNGNECVDVKEGSHDNLIEYNNCSGQRDPESGGLDARGNNNIFRNNIVNDTLGAGIRLGGDDEQDGINNQVYENSFSSNDKGSLKVLRYPQELLCGNIDNNLQPHQSFKKRPREAFEPC